jgi:CMP-N-acetylneuraminic acid synthetase
VLSKNVYPVLGRPLSWYPMRAAKQSVLADEIYITTDCPKLKHLANSESISIIDRPASISQDTSELLEAIDHAVKIIGGDITYLVTMHCNCGVHREGLVDECLRILHNNPEADSCVSGYIDHSVHPFRTKKITDRGYLESWIDIPVGTSTNRQSLDPCFILDGAVRAMRYDKCFPPNGQRPFTYLGKRILPIVNADVGDVHSLRDIINTEDALIKHGWKSEDKK